MIKPLFPGWQSLEGGCDPQGAQQESLQGHPSKVEFSQRGEVHFPSTGETAREKLLPHK